MISKKLKLHDCFQEHGKTVVSFYETTYFLGLPVLKELMIAYMDKGIFINEDDDKPFGSFHQTTLGNLLDGQK